MKIVFERSVRREVKLRKGEGMSREEEDKIRRICVEIDRFYLSTKRNGLLFGRNKEKLKKRIEEILKE